MAAAHLSGRPCAGCLCVVHNPSGFWAFRCGLSLMHHRNRSSIQWSLFSPACLLFIAADTQCPCGFLHTHVPAFSYRQQCRLRIHARFCTPHHCANFKIWCYVPESIRVCSIMHCAICGFWPEVVAWVCFLLL